MTSKYKEIFNKLAEERFEEITQLDKIINPNNLLHSSTADRKINEFHNTFSLLDKIKESKISLIDEKMIKQKFKSNLSEKIKQNKIHRSKEQKNTLHNIERLYNERNNVIKMF